MNNFANTFREDITKKLMEKMGIKNPMAIPKLVKIVVNMSSSDFLSDKKNFDAAAGDLAVITGQKPKVSRARISVATFKLREGDRIGLSVTLRGKRMYDFFEKLVTIVLPRVRDFSGVDYKDFDGRGNITLGFYENIVFPEIDLGKVDKIRGLQVIIVTSAGSNERGKVFLETMGMPFKKSV